MGQTVTTVQQASDSGWQPKDVWTLVVAIYAAVVATGATIWQVVRERPAALVHVSGLIELPASGAANHLWHVRVINPRAIPVEVVQIGLAVAGKDWAQFVPRPYGLNSEPIEKLPKVVGQGTSLSYYFEQNQGKALGDVVGAYVTDTRGQTHFGYLPRSRAPKALLVRLRQWHLRRKHFRKYSK